MWHGWEIKQVIIKINSREKKELEESWSQNDFFVACINFQQNLSRGEGRGFPRRGTLKGVPAKEERFNSPQTS